jgi:predicted transcriptional regulator
MIAGSKSVELRRRRLKVAPGTRVWIYSTAPDARVKAVATVHHVETAEPERIWSNYKDIAGVSAEEFRNYLAGCRFCCAVVLREIRPLAKAAHLSDLRQRLRRFHPPQFFKRLQSGAPELALLRKLVAH